MGNYSLWLVLFTMLISSSAAAHFGTADEFGCHTNGQIYHCHGAGDDNTIRPDTGNQDDPAYDYGKRHCAYGAKYGAGFVLGLTIGFGLGHAMQCRWTHGGGWVFTASQLIAASLWLRADERQVSQMGKYAFFLSKLIEVILLAMPPDQKNKTDQRNINTPPTDNAGLQLSLHCPMPCTMKGLSFTF